MASTFTGFPSNTPVAAPTCVRHFRPYPAYGTFVDVNGVTGCAALLAHLFLISRLFWFCFSFTAAPLLSLSSLSLLFRFSFTADALLSSLLASSFSPAGSAAPNCQAAANSSLYYGSATVFPGANGACYTNASSPACATCAAAANAPSAYNVRAPLPRAAAPQRVFSPPLLRRAADASPPSLQSCQYLSPLSCHATFSGLVPNTKYSFTIASTVTGGSAPGAYLTSAAEIAGGAFSFIAPALPSAAGANAGYPLKWVLMADVGQARDRRRDCCCCCCLVLL